jgi:uncharacterized repeat protein (TIGR01451 family)
MNTSKLLILGVLMLSLAVTGSAFGLDAKISCGNTAYFVSNDAMAQCVFPGDEIYYIVSVGLGANDYPIINGVVTFTTPDGTSYTLDTNLSLGTGETKYYNVTVDAEGWENYIVNCEDGSSSSQCTALSVLETGYASVTGTGTWDLSCKIPCIDVTKTPDTDISKIGDTINYEICVTNCSTGNETLCDLTLSNIQVEDTLLGTITLPDTELEVGESVCVTVEYEVQEGDPDPLVNTVTASGEMYDPGAVDTPVVVTGEYSASVNLFQPSITITKECDESAVVDGAVNYLIIVENTSSDDSPNLIGNVTDTLLGDLGPVNLAPGETAVFTPSLVVLDTDPNPLENTATVTVSPEGFPNVLEESATCSTNILTPDLTVTKVCLTPTVTPGEDAEFQITITNTGEVGLIIDTDEPEIGTGVALAPGGIIQVNVLRTAVETVVFNEINVVATVPGTDVVLLRTASDTCAVASPDFTVTKVCLTPTVSPGEDAEFEITITNTGDVDLIITTDEPTLPGPLPLPAGGPAIVQSVFIPVVDSDVSNTITVIATVPVAETEPIVKSASDTCAVVLNPLFTVTKVCLTPAVTPGEDAEFEITITNTGDVDLIIDTDETEIGTDVSLVVDQVIQVTVVRTAGDTDVENTITVTATVPGHPEINPIVLSASDTCTVEVPGNEGCTPGFWKNNADKHDASAWCDLFAPVGGDPPVYPLFETVFGITLPEPLRAKGKAVYENPTLLDALNANGGGINALARHATAALLNACSDCVNYASNDPGYIIGEVQATINGEEDALSISELHSMFADWNEAGCPVNQHGECSN